MTSCSPSAAQKGESDCAGDFLPVDLRGAAAEMGSEIRVRKLAAEKLNVARLNVKTRKLKVQENFPFL